MQASLRELLNEAIDYAGPFPPARLPLADALREYQAWLQTDRAFLTSRFCCPAKSLPELGSLLGAEPIRVSVIGGTCGSEVEWDDLRAEEARLMTDFLVSQESEIQAYEVAIPSNSVADDWYDKLKGFSSADVFVELPWDAQMGDAVAASADHDWISLKARTGGTFVESSHLAEFIWNAMSLEIPFKLTGGLHHALRTRDANGFVNVFTACVLAYAADFGPQQLAAVLDCESPALWSFGADGFTWAGDEMSIDDIAAARSIFAGFGSCSLSEPWQSLQGLGWD
ncbi:MAG TPA: hypothetical protein VG944_14875 [Fimbriimonas sp.]|nr:hypothetical protein [Fimbriimonas sp.]